MRFRVGARDYKVRIAPGPITLEGVDVMGVTTASDREILISAACPLDERLGVLIRELGRAWTFDVGEPSTPDDWGKLIATVTIAAMRSLNLQGGEMALKMLRPGESPEPMAARIPLKVARECARCQGPVAGGSVAWAVTALEGVAELRIYCEFCGHTQIWHEGTVAGVPNCQAIGEPQYEPGDTTGLTRRQPAA